MNKDQPKKQINRKPIIILLFILILALVFTLAFFVNFLNSEAKECINSPVLYGINKIHPNIKCACSSTSDDFYFNINNTDIWQPKEKGVVVQF